MEKITLPTAAHKELNPAVLRPRLEYMADLLSDLFPTLVHQRETETMLEALLGDGDTMPSRNYALLSPLRPLLRGIGEDHWLAGNLYLRFHVYQGPEPTSYWVSLTLDGEYRRYRAHAHNQHQRDVFRVSEYGDTPDGAVRAFLRAYSARWVGSTLGPFLPHQHPDGAVYGWVQRHPEFKDVLIKKLI